MPKLSENVELQKAMKRVKVVDKIRIIFLFIALLLVLFIFYGNKFATDAAWYQTGKAFAYEFLFIAVLIMLGATISKMVLAAAYNKKLKQYKEAK